MRKRLLQAAVAAVVLLSVATAAGYFGMRVGRSFQLNQMCCQIYQRHNFEISVRERLGLLTFPSQIGQDRWVAEKVFRGVTNGYFLDVGSADGFVNSNTWALEDFYPWGDSPTVLWRLGYAPEDWNAPAEARVVNSTHRHANFDYATNTVRWQSG